VDSFGSFTHTSDAPTGSVPGASSPKPIFGLRAYLTRLVAIPSPSPVVLLYLSFPVRRYHTTRLTHTRASLMDMCDLLVHKPGTIALCDTYSNLP